ncbi:MAG: UvrD-helicase domain-containing protein [Lachnospiraceae bacterium]|nr:UvrD-helicase domain-containing protein [Lachnospiraceae bacterium]
MTDYEEELNDKQLEAVKTTEGPVLILAGAGSGKTRALTYRTAYLIEELGVKPWSILALTFTNKAAREMRERVAMMCPEESRDIMVSTFHSLCLRILFVEAERLGYGKNFEVADQTDQRAIVKEICKRLQVDTKQYKEKSLLNAISGAKDELMSPEDFAREHEGDFYMKPYVEVYKEYQKTLKANDQMDFDDLILNVIEIFQTYPEVLEHYQDRYRYIMVDEYQDTNRAQFILVSLLAKKYRNLCVVGDDDQSIYAFRGADIRNILDFEKIYKDAHVVRLEQNYRSTSNILAVANQVIANNKGRKPKELWTEAEEGRKIRFRQLDSAAGEAAFIADDIRSTVTAGKAHYKDFAILIRTNVQSKDFEDAFRVRGIDYDLVKGLRFWDTRVIKDVTGFLLTVAVGTNDMRTARVINIPKRGIGAASLEKLVRFAGVNGISLLEACSRPENAGVSGKAAKGMKDFYEMIMSLKERTSGKKLADMLDEVLKVTDYMTYLADEADTTEKYLEQQEYIGKLKDSLTEYESEAEEPSIVDFMRMNGVEGTTVDVDTDPSNDDKVLIMTMHNSKGLEFPHVYMAGMEEGLFPGYMSISSGDDKDIEEERRLCYVGITRAMEELTLTCARARMVNGETRYATASRFVKEMPFGLLDMNVTPEKTERPVRFSDGSMVLPGKSAFGDRNDQSSFRSLPGPGTDSGYRPLSKAVPRTVPKRRTPGKIQLGRDIKPVKPDYTTGDRVRHFKFGEGSVLDIKEGVKDYEITVDFDDHGVKKMYAGFAKLKKL